MKQDEIGKDFLNLNIEDYNSVSYMCKNEISKANTYKDQREYDIYIESYARNDEGYCCDVYDFNAMI